MGDERSNEARGVSGRGSESSEGNAAYLLHILQLALQGSVVRSFPSVETLKTNTVSVISVEEEHGSQTHVQHQMFPSML